MGMLLCRFPCTSISLADRNKCVWAQVSVWVRSVFNRDIFSTFSDAANVKAQNLRNYKCLLILRQVFFLFTHTLFPFFIGWNKSFLNSLLWMMGESIYWLHCNYKKSLCIQGSIKINSTSIRKRNVDTPYGNKKLAIWISLELIQSENTLLGL